MKKVITKMVQTENNDMRPEYDFSGGVRGKHYRSMQTGYMVTIHKEDGTTVTKDVLPKESVIIIEPDIRAYFPNSESVNKALRCLIPLISKKYTAKA